MNECCCLILNYNDSDTVCKLVEKIKNYKVFKYILIVDNCSTDNSYERIFTLKSDKIIVIQTTFNGGYGAGNNYGIKYAKNVLECKYVLLSNPDVSFSESLVHRLLEVCSLDSDAALATAIQHDSENKAIQDIAWRIPTAFEYAVMSTRLGRKILNQNYRRNWLDRKNICEVECVPGAMLLYDADKFCNVGGYDEGMFLFCEETTIGFKLKQAGYKTILCTDVFYIHEHSVTINKSINDKIKQMQLIFDNRNLFMKKYLKAGPAVLKFAKYLQKRTLRIMLKQSNVF